MNVCTYVYIYLVATDLHEEKIGKSQDVCFKEMVVKRKEDLENVVMLASFPSPCKS